MPPRRALPRLLGSALLVAVTAAALVSSPSTALATSPAGALNSADAGASTFEPPARIVSDCSQDVSDALRSWLYSLPAGTPEHPVVVKFAPNGCYQIDSSLYLRNFRDTVFDGNGSTFRRTSQRTIVIPLRASDPPAYCGSDFVQPNLHQAYQQTVLPIVWWFEGGCDLVVENMTVDGNLSGPGGGSKEQDSAIQMNGVQRAMVRDVTVDNIEGDFVTVSGLHEAPGGGGGYPSTDVRITGNHFDNSGRQGVTTEYVDRVSVDHNYLTHVAATMFDIESDVVGGKSADISITDNTIDGPYYAYLLAAYTGSAVSDLAFVGNNLVNGAQIKMAFQPGQPASNITIEGNTATGVAGWPFAAIRFIGPGHGDPLQPVSHVEIMGNTVPVEPYNGGANYRGSPFVSADPGTVSDLVVRDNLLARTIGWNVPSSTTAAVLPLELAQPGDVWAGDQSCGNSQNLGQGAVDGACTGPTSPPDMPSALIPSGVANVQGSSVTSTPAPGGGGATYTPPPQPGSTRSPGPATSLPVKGVRGYWLAGSDGGIFAFGTAGFHGSTGKLFLNRPIVGMAATPDGRGYWLVASDGGVFAFGDAGYYGSTGNMVLNRPIVGMAATPDGRGYWLVASDGGIFAFGDAGFYGSTGNLFLNQPVVGMAADRATGGYWLVARDGGVFSFDAPFLGSTGNIHLNQPVVGMSAMPNGGGYRFVAADGGIFDFGGARFFGSTGWIPLHRPVVGMSTSADGNGYWLVASDGGIFAFGDAGFYGSTGNMYLNRPIMGMAAP